MAWPTIAIPIISEIFGIGKDYLLNKREEGKAKHERKVELIRQQGSWEEIMAEGSKTSWKDEWFTVVLSIPLIGSFFPNVVPHIEEGFKALESTPAWYQALLFAAVATSFGVKKLADIKKGK